jgi:hypothetical protein
MSDREAASDLGARLAQALIERLQLHVPDGVELGRYEGSSSIWATAANGESADIEFQSILEEWLEDELPIEDAIEHVIWMVLSHIQDFIVEFVLRDRWPRIGDRVPGADPLPEGVGRRAEKGYELFYAPGLVLRQITDEELGLT